MGTFILVACSVINQTKTDVIDANTFKDMMVEFASEVTSIDLIYEGTIQYNDKNGKPDLGKQTSKFQGSYMIRTENSVAGLNELFTMKPPHPETHWSIAVLNNQVETSDDAIPSQVNGSNANKLPKKFGGLFSLSGHSSPSSYLYYWYFSSYKFIDSKILPYEFMGWDTVDNNRCMKVKLGRLPGGDIDHNYYIFWIDPHHGYHPRKIEHYYKDGLLSRSIISSLSQVKLETGKTIWFPMHAELNIYGMVGRPLQTTPKVFETSGVVVGSLRLNTNLVDSQFVVHTNNISNYYNHININKNHNSAFATTSTPRMKTDAASIQARLDQNLHDANLQKSQLEASSPSRELYSWTGILQTLGVLLSLFLFCGAGYLKWKSYKC